MSDTRTVAGRSGRRPSQETERASLAADDELGGDERLQRGRRRRGKLRRRGLAGRQRGHGGDQRRAHHALTPRCPYIHGCGVQM